ncbi:phytanoyl-CoA dioxygenase family protein [Arthrobacter sp. HY1533]|uniref:phytanoyl-CoA dioxygenase family protein n=1 Tax=Arthrobacter sp. HY1533 TaxID=2970919 RepID=UPI0022BA0EC5|nr:phytanoyl-CoA dioxygenase family protein [Arthrobacter sp. HY1533]
MSLARVDDLGGAYADSLYATDVLANTVGNLPAVDVDAIEEYRALGFLSVREALTPQENQQALAGLRHLIDNPKDGVDLQFEAWAQDQLAQLHGDDRMDAVRKLQKFTHAEDRLLGIANHPGILRTVKAIIGTDDIVLLQDMALLKPPGGGREKPWHQDKAFFNLDLDATIVGVWIALDAATPENGCMHVIPGSHREGPIPHFKRRDWQICDTDVDTARNVAVPLDPGGLLFFDGYIHHGTPQNRTATRRRALQFHYVARDVLRITEEERLAVFGLEGRGAEC